MILGLLAAAAVATAPPTLDAAADALDSNAAAIHARYDLNPYAYIDRLHALDSALSRTHDAVSGISADLARERTIELQLDAAMLSSAPPSLERVRGVAESIVHTSQGGDAVGVYVAPSPAQDGRYGLVVMLHGRGETEADVLARGLFQSLADRHHAIIFAPWANADDMWESAAESEVLHEMDRLTRAYAVDPRRTFLAGISMGGAGAFHIGSAHVDRFAGILSIVGDLAGRDVRMSRMAFKDKPVYLVMAGRDPIMAPAANAYTIRNLATACVPFSSYLAPDGGHNLNDVSAQVEEAWNDMFGGIVRAQNRAECSGSPGGVPL